MEMQAPAKNDSEAQKAKTGGARLVVERVLPPPEAVLDAVQQLLHGRLVLPRQPLRVQRRAPLLVALALLLRADQLLLRASGGACRSRVSLSSPFLTQLYSL